MLFIIWTCVPIIRPAIRATVDSILILSAILAIRWEAESRKWIITTHRILSYAIICWIQNIAPRKTIFIFAKSSLIHETSLEIFGSTVCYWIKFYSCVIYRALTSWFNDAIRTVITVTYNSILRITIRGIINIIQLRLLINIDSIHS